MFFLMCKEVVENLRHRLQLLNTPGNIFRIQRQLKEEYNYAQNQFYREIYKGELEFQNFRYDTYQHMCKMKGLLLEKKYNELEESIISYGYQVKKSIRQKINSNNAMVDAILNPLIFEAKNQGIPVYILGRFPEEISVNSYDLCAILSNALLNSIKKCKELPTWRNRYVEVCIKSFRQTLFISIASIVSETVDCKMLNNEIGRGEKRNYEVGIRTIIETVKRNGGDIEFKSKDNVFVIQILLYDVVRDQKECI